MIRITIVVMALLCGGCKSGYYVFGDSLTANIEPSASWASQINQLRVQHPNVQYPYMQWQAVPAMTIMGFDLPNWIKPFNEIQGLLIVLGANDVLRGTSPALYRAKMAEIVTQAHLQGFDDVVCVVVVDYPADLVGICDKILTVPLYLSDSPDGLHMGPEGSLEFGLQILVKLGE